MRGFDPEKYFEAGRDAYLDRFAQFSVVAAREAMRDSGLELTPGLRENGAVICGSAVGGQQAIETGFEDLYVSGRGRVHPLTIPKTMANAGASGISMDLGLTGPTYTVSTACSSANHAIGQAFRLVRDGDADLAVTGRRRSAVYSWAAEGLGSDARDFAGYLPPVQQRPQGNDSGRRRRDDDSRAARSREGARREEFTARFAVSA